MDGKYKTKDDRLITLRTGILGDRVSIQNIDIKSFDLPWGDRKFKLNKDVTRVAIVDGRVVAFWIATIEEAGDIEYVNILRLAVTPSFRRLGIGSVLMEDILVNYNYLACSTLVLDYQLSAQMFLKSNGFKYIKSLREVPIPGIGNSQTYLFRRDADV